MTSKHRKIYILLSILSIILNCTPIVYYTVKAFIESSATVHKVALCSSIFISLILTLISLVTKVSLRSTLWILIIGLYLCLDSLINMIIFIAICQVIDEMIITPLKKSEKQKLVINKELDKRMTNASN